LYTPDGTTAADQFTFTGAEKIDFVDYALLMSDIKETKIDKTVSIETGDDLNTNVSGSFYAVRNNQYYFHSGHGKSAISYTDVKITDYEFFNNLGQPAAVAGKSVMDYEALQTQGIELGYKPNIQKCAVVKLAGPVIPDAASTSKIFSAATWNNYSPGGALSSAQSSTFKYESE